jgi:hypothetical protein
MARKIKVDFEMEGSRKAVNHIVEMVFKPKTHYTK